MFPVTALNKILEIIERRDGEHDKIRNLGTEESDQHPDDMMAEDISKVIAEAYSRGIQDGARQEHIRKTK